MSPILAAKHALSLSAVRRTPTARFLTGALAGSAAVIIPISAWLLSMAPTIPLGLTQLVPLVGQWMAGLGIGSLIAARAMHPFLSQEAGLGGRRSVIAGGAAAVSLLTAAPFMGPRSVLVQIGVGVVAGAAWTAAMFWPWLVSSATRSDIGQPDAQLRAND